MADKKFSENYLESLRLELIHTVEKDLTPSALRYGYSDIPLESNIKWRPMVLVLGNYSSGKSTLINEFIGGGIQQTGQAPTDDSFTVITDDDRLAVTDDVKTTEERDGKVLLSDPQYPFEILRKHGDRFSSHFKLKKVKSPFLKNLAIVDTPGMLDSISEKDRGYDYQEVIGDLAQVADLILILFDPHKAGTVQEVYHSLRNTLPKRTFEDRVVFVLNRIDECGTLSDLLRVYGSLCWNLSQITGRKDIPQILLTYSPSVASQIPSETEQFLGLLNNQRDRLKEIVGDTPRHRLDHLATFIGTHSQRISHLVEAILSFARKARNFKVKLYFLGLVLSLLIGAGVGFYFMNVTGSLNEMTAAGTGVGIAILLYVFWSFIVSQFLVKLHNLSIMTDLDCLTSLKTQTRMDSWEYIKGVLEAYLQSDAKLPSVGQLRKELATLNRVYKQGSEQIRKAINEYDEHKFNQGAE